MYSHPSQIRGIPRPDLAGSLVHIPVALQAESPPGGVHNDGLQAQDRIVLAVKLTLVGPPAAQKIGYFRTAVKEPKRHAHTAGRWGLLPCTTYASVVDVWE